MNTFERIYEIIKSIPFGKVATYGQIAAYAGNPHWARVVGYALNICSDPVGIPWHRVVARNGRIATSHSNDGQSLQRTLLESEGVEFTAEGLVDMKRFMWNK